MVRSLSTSRRLIGCLCAVLGAGLLGIAALGQWTSWGHDHREPARPGEKFDPALAAELTDYTRLRARAVEKMAAAGTDAEKMRALCELVAVRFTHEEAHHTLASNWILAAAGLLHPTLGHMWSPRLIVAHGSTVLCDQASYVMMDMALAQGYPARHIGLQGHVVLEVWYGGDWHLYDPDLEVIPTQANGEVASLDELATDEPLLAASYGHHPRMADLIRTRQNHLYMSTPNGARFEWKANLLAVMEQVAEVVKFLLPLALLLAGLWLLRPLPSAPPLAVQDESLSE